MSQASLSTRQLLRMAHAAMQKNRGQEAVDLLQQVLTINPHHAEALYHIAFIMHGAGNDRVAGDFYERAIQADPHHIESYLMLAKLRETQGRSNEALQLVQHSAQIAPQNPDTHLALVSLLMRFHQAHLVPGYLEPILPQFSNTLELQQFYCFALKINGRRDEADAHYQKLISKARIPAAFRIMYETYLPRLYRCVAEIDAMRRDFKASVERFIAEKPRIQPGMLSSHYVFSLAYHQRDNKELTQLYTRMLRACAPELTYTAPHCTVAPVASDTPIRVGFISAHMHNHSVGNCYRSVMLYLAAQPEFSVTFFNLSNVVDDKIQEMHAAGLPIVSLPKHIKAAQEVVASHRLDLIIYPDIGMDAMTHYLAMARLARYQCCLLGHPETTGIDTIDYVISSRSYEPPDADQNYTERLLCNAGIDTIFRRPHPPAQWLTRQELGLPIDKKLYVCPMAIQKFHPDFDVILADILARDPNATLVLFNDFHQQGASDLLKQRILEHCDASRIIFLGWQPLDLLFSIMKTADAILDTIYFGGGTTAQYAFGLGFPITTMPSQYARGRVVYSYYALMGIENPPVAETPAQYVELAVRLANESGYAQAIREQILSNNHKLFESAPNGPHIAQMIKDIMQQQLAAYAR
jgi:protein O-GlcNAc transferase